MTKKVLSKGDYKLDFKLSNAVTLNRWLNQLPLAGQRSRQRNQFTVLLRPAVDEVEAKRIELLKSYAEKNEDGTTKTFIEDGVENFDITDENQKKFNDELTQYITKDYSVSFPDVKVFEAVRDIIYTTDFQFSGQMAVEYDAWCTAFEAA